MNPVAERERNKRYIHAFDGGFYKILEIHTKDVTYMGKKWSVLSSFEKRKFENMLVITEAPQPIKCKYI